MNSPLTGLLERSILIAATAHQHQVDKADVPYILHALRLMLRGETLLEQVVAVLHDVVEDSDWTLEQLAVEGLPPEAIVALDCLTRRPKESYEEFIDRVLTDSLATRVKRYDLEDNMNLTRMQTMGDRDLERLKRYHAAHQRVLAALAEKSQTPPAKPGA